LLKIEGPVAYHTPYKILMLPGNPYWSFNCQSDLSKLIDLAKFRDGAYKFIATAEDVAGNKKTDSITVYLDRELEKPKLDFTSFKQDDVFSEILPLYGKVDDDDGVKEVIMNIFKEGKKEIVLSKIIPSPYGLSESVDISELEEGKYRLELIPADYYVKGNPTNVNFWIDRSYPRFDTDFINKEWAGKIFNGKLDIPLKVIKYGDLKSVKYSIVYSKTNKVVVKDKALKILQNNNGVCLMENIKEDIFKDAPDNPRGLYIIKLSAADKRDKKVFIDIPVFIDDKAPSVSEIKIDQKIGMIKDEVVTIEDDFLLKEVAIEISGQQKIILKAGEEKEIKLKTKSADGKNFLNYSASINAFDTANNSKKYSFNINFKETKSVEHRLKIVAKKNQNAVFGNSPTLFIESDKNSIDSLDSFYGFAPIGFANFQIKIEDGEIKDFSTINKENGVYFSKISEDIRKDMKLGENRLKFFTKEDNSGDVKISEIREVVFDNDKKDPYGKIFFPPAYAAFNEDITFYGVCSDDSKKITISYSFDLTSDSNFKEISLFEYDNISEDSVPIIEPLLREKKQPVWEYLETYGVNLIEGGKYFKVTVPVEGLKDGERKIYFKLKDNAGKETIIDSVVAIDFTKPELKVWIPEEKEILNGKITVRGEAKDNYYLTNTVFIMNEGKVIADGRFIWDGLYDLYNLDSVDLESSETKDLSIDIVAFDSAGNKKSVTKAIKFDTKSDKPIVYINSPSVQ
ncbi:MAG TPA: hypothetical protein PLO89_06235, partial [Spirochaetota bacterium]|nr:hypothetical protein [Spirochaetota bacterium]